LTDEPVLDWLNNPPLNCPLWDGIVVLGIDGVPERCQVDGQKYPVRINLATHKTLSTSVPT